MVKIEKNAWHLKAQKWKKTSGKAVNKYFKHFEYFKIYGLIMPAPVHPPKILLYMQYSMIATNPTVKQTMNTPSPRDPVFIFIQQQRYAIFTPVNQVSST